MVTCIIWLILAQADTICDEYIPNLVLVILSFERILLLFDCLKISKEVKNVCDTSEVQFLGLLGV